MQCAPTKQNYLKKYWRAGEPSGKNRRDVSADTLAAAADATPVLQNHFCSPLLPVLPPALVKLFGEQILEALVYLHSKQIHFGKPLLLCCALTSHNTIVLLKKRAVIHFI